MKRFKILMFSMLIFILLGFKIYANLDNDEEIQVSSEVQEKNNDKEIRLPILMYHQILKEPKTWGKYVVSPDEFEKDVIYLIEKGYTTINMQDIIDFTYEGKPLPEKPIMITFDDGYLTGVEYIMPILEKYKVKAVFSIVGEYTDRFTNNPDRKLSYSHMNWDDVKKMVDCEYTEIQNHSYNMHSFKGRRGAAKKKGESMEDYRKALENDVLYLQNLIKEHTGYTPTTFTYPFGELSSAGEIILKEMGFKATISCTEGVNILTGKPEELYYLRRYNRAASLDRAKLFDKFE